MTISASTPIRVVVLLTSISLALVLLLAGAVAQAEAGTEAPVVTITEVRHPVVAGDTLWDIAVQYTEPGDDVRDTIYDIKRATGLSDSVIRVGDVLVIPVDF